MSLISNLMNIPANGLRLGGHKVLICVCGGVIDQTGPYVLSCCRSAGAQSRHQAAIMKIFDELFHQVVYHQFWSQ